MDTVMDADRLAAFVDGEIAPEDAAAVVLHLADCPGDRAYVDALMEVGTLFAAAYAEPLHQPVPERLRAVVYPAAGPRPGPPRPTARRGLASPAARRRTVGWGLAALAASALLAIGLVSRPDPVTTPVAGDIAAGTTLHVALEVEPSGPAGEGLMLIATFRDSAGRPCREFEARAAQTGVVTRGIACRERAGGWTTIASLSETAPVTSEPRQAFVPAGGADVGDLDAALDRIGAGMTLTPTEESALLRSGWKD